MRLKQGSVVRIYYDPTTKEEPEGLARLVRLLNVDGDIQLWEVMFLMGKVYAERYIVDE